MKPTHRIYLRILAREPQQVDRVTGQFFDINVEASIEMDEARWYRVTGAGGRSTYETFTKADGEGVHEMLGMRMLLRGNHWYANAQDVDLDMAYMAVVRAEVPGRALTFAALAAVLALTLAATEGHLFGAAFTWEQYWMWAVAMLVWMSVKEWWDSGR